MKGGRCVGCSVVCSRCFGVASPGDDFVFRHPAEFDLTLRGPRQWGRELTRAGAVSISEARSATGPRQRQILADRRRRSSLSSLRETALQTNVTPSQWPILGRATTGAPNFGGFIGYNTQWQDLVFGVEANLQRATFKLVSPNIPISRTTAADSSGNAYSVTLTGCGRGRTWISHFASKGRLCRRQFHALWIRRVRLGFGKHVGERHGFGTRIHFGHHRQLHGAAVFSLCLRAAAREQSRCLYGFTVGGGVDVALTPNSLRARNSNWTSSTRRRILCRSSTTGRVGAAYKF